MGFFLSGSNRKLIMRKGECERETGDAVLLAG